MAEKKGWGSTVMGWFITQDGVTAGADYQPFSDVTADSSAPAGDAAAPAAPMPEVFSSTPPAAKGGKVDFDAVFSAAAIEPQETERVAKAIELLQSLPPGTDPAVRKQIVEASLRAFGVPIDKIIETGVAEIQALEAYIRSGASDSQKLMDESDERIKALEKEIANVRTIMQQSVEEQKSVLQSCNTKKLDIQGILEFFGQEAVARVVKESPKLHEPAAAQ
jgi:flagellar motility protein MotE (MotC chaperone)